MPLTEQVLAMPNRHEELIQLGLHALNELQELIRNAPLSGEEYLHANQLIERYAAVNRELGAMDKRCN